MGRERSDATVLDVSLSGLSVQTSLDLDQGDPVELLIEGRVLVQALAWNARRARRAEGTQHVVGMMLSDVGADYEALVARVAGSRPAPGGSPAPAEAGPASVRADAGAPGRRRGHPPLPAQRPTWWRLRVKQREGPRMRVVTLAAATREEAIARSLAEMGGGWDVLEAIPASATAGR